MSAKMVTKGFKSNCVQNFRRMYRGANIRYVQSLKSVVNKGRDFFIIGKGQLVTTLLFPLVNFGHKLVFNEQGDITL